MRTAIKTKTPLRQQRVKTKTYPAPIGGWNARDALAEMPPTDAVYLDNFFPKASYCELRGGSSAHTTGSATDLLTENGDFLSTEDDLVLTTEETSSALTGTIKTLAVYNGMNGVNKMFAFTEQFIYDTTTGGNPLTTSLARTDGKHQWTMFGDGTSNWLIACNGIDKPAYYDGTTWTAVDSGTSPAILGIASDQLVQPLNFKNRLMFVVKGSLSFWYLPPTVAGGTLLEFDLSSICRRGGYLQAIGKWTRDAGDGQDDVFVAVTSEGECVLYQGNNPSDANDWSMIGSFFIGKPLGRRCLTQYGGDLVVITENGAFPLSAALPSASINYKLALSYKVEKAFTEAGRIYGDVFGWEAINFPAQQALIVNVPTAEDSIHYQYVMNTMTQSWCRFLGWDAETFVIFNRDLYFARGSDVYLAWAGTSDLGNDIAGYGKQAFSYFGSTTALKRFSLYRPMLIVDGPVSYFSGIDVDFEDTDVTNLTAATAGSQSLWDVAQWDVDLWGGEPSTLKQWNSVAQYPGFCAAGKLKIVTKAVTPQWMAGDYVWEEGGIL